MADVTNRQLSRSRRRESEPIIPAKEDDVSRSSEFYLNMIKAQLDQAKDALDDGYVARARNLIEVVIADCRMLIVGLGGKTAPE